MTELLDSGSVGDARFFARSGPHFLAEVAAVANGTTAGNRDRVLTGIAPLRAASPDEVSFLDNKRYLSVLEQTRAGAVIVHPDMASHVPSSASPILTASPYEGWAHVAALFHPHVPASPGIHRTACVAEGATIDPTAEIGPFACIEAGARIGPRCRIGAFTNVGAGVVIGADCRIAAHVTISHALLGARVSLHPGVRIGQEGFGFARTAGGFLTIPHLGRVVIGDDVEVGANATVDRGSIQDTVIGSGSRLDNLVQVAHNVSIGRCCVIVAQVGIAGSTVIEDFVQVGGQAAMAGHIRVGRGAQIGAQAGVISDVPEGSILLGSPAQPRKEFFRQVATLRRLARRTSD